MADQFLDANGLDYYTKELKKQLKTNVVEGEGVNSVSQISTSSNHAIGINSAAFGENSYSGAHGFRVIAWNPGTYDPTTQTHINNDYADTYYIACSGYTSKEELETLFAPVVADQVTLNIYLKESKDFFAKVTSIEILPVGEVPDSCYDDTLISEDDWAAKIIVDEKVVLNYPNKWNDEVVAQTIKEDFFNSYIIFNGYYHLGNLNIGTNTASFGGSNTAIGYGAFTAGYNSKAVGKYSAAFGNTTEAAYAGFTSGLQTKAHGLHSVAVNYSTKTKENGYGSQVATGLYTEGNGVASFAGGIISIADGVGSQAFGLKSIATEEGQFVVGKNNAQNKEALFIVGNGPATFNGKAGVTGATKKGSNAFAVLKDGRAVLGAAPINDMDVVNKKYLNDNTCRSITKMFEISHTDIDATTGKLVGVEGWFRIAQAPSNLISDILHVHTNQGGYRTSLTITTELIYPQLDRYGMSTSIPLLNVTDINNRSAGSCKEVRIIYDTSASSNLTYLDIYIARSAKLDKPIEITLEKLDSGLNKWQLLDKISNVSDETIGETCKIVSVTLEDVIQNHRTVSEVPSNPDPNTLYYVV